MVAKNGASVKKEKVNNPVIVKQDSNVNKVLVENFVSLQKVMTNLAIKFDNLSIQISKLLELFEISAKTLAEKDYGKKEDNKKVVEKLDALLEHDKIIARGIAMLHERANAEEPQEVVIPSQPIQRQMPMNYQPQQMQQRPPVSRVIETDRYQKLPSESTQKTREMGM
ncbi:Uncharacterised protein [uncultured archaeon]|nr:Uncharacterised protein [uncultured archaeon]